MADDSIHPGDRVGRITWNHPAPHPPGCECGWCEELADQEDSA